MSSILSSDERKATFSQYGQQDGRNQNRLCQQIGGLTHIFFPLAFIFYFLLGMFGVLDDDTHYVQYVVIFAIQNISQGSAQVSQ